MEFTAEQVSRIHVLAAVGAHSKRDPAVRARTLAALREDRWRVASFLTPDDDGAPLVASLYFRVDVETAGVWSPLAVVGWRPLGLDLAQVIAEAAEIRAATEAGERVPDATPPDVVFVHDDMPDTPPAS